MWPDGYVHVEVAPARIKVDPTMIQMVLTQIIMENKCGRGWMICNYGEHTGFKSRTRNRVREGKYSVGKYEISLALDWLILHKLVDANPLDDNRIWLLADVTIPGPRG